MANKNTKPNVSKNENQEVKEVITTETAEVKPSKTTKAKTPAKKSKPKDKKPNRIVKRVKETSSELKKVSWPSFSTVVKKTGVVLAVVLIFAVVLFGIDRFLSWIIGLLTGIGA